MRNFKRLSDRKNVNLETYLKDYFQKYPSTKIYISSDSQAVQNRIVWATVVILYNRNLGGHVLYSKQHDMRTVYGKQCGRDYMKLYKETELTLELASYLRDDLGYEIDQIGLDYNTDEKYFSNKLLTDTIGWIKSLGYNVVGKPNPFVAVSDKISRTG
jgi:predicted RNase H-related nuclease YkuK (DUF458 family)